MKAKLIVPVVASCLMAAGCSHADKAQPQAPQRSDDGMAVRGGVAALPRAVVYRTDRDYSGLVAVTLDATGRRIVSFPDPADLRGADPRPLLARRNRLFPHGLIGTRMVAGFLILPFGRISDSDRDGGRPHLNRPPLPYGDLLGDTAENFDCCGFFVHVDCFRAFGLRFDPLCAWDLYAEDLCFQFIRATGHRVRILPLAAHHWSRGDATTPRFLATRDALNRKYADTLFAGGTCTLTVGGLPPLRIRLLRRLARLLPRWR